ncbi:MAG: hypothetical protein ACJ741_17250 [Pyrinomonadaceae bacterium]
MKLKRLTPLSLLAPLLFAHAAWAQTVAAIDNKTSDADAARAVLERKALGLLDEVGEEAQGLKLVENRVRLEVAAADLLWPRDEKRAREILNAAFASLASATASIPLDDPRHEQSTQQALNLRREIVQAVAQRDPQLALDLLRSTRPPSAPNISGRDPYQSNQELALEASIAEQVAARDPHQALRLAEEILARGISSQLSSVVERMRASDPEGATRLAADIARKLRTANFATDYEAANLTVYLLGATRATAAPRNAPVVGRQPVALDDQARRDLLGTAVNAALSQPNGAPASGGRQYLLNSLQAYLPEIEKSMPMQAQALRQRAGAAARPTANTSQRELQSATQAATVDAMLDLASKASPEASQQIYRTAAFRALNEGATERARQIIGEHFDNADVRAQALHELDQQLFWRAANSGDFEQAHAQLARLARTEEQSGLLLYLARAVADRGDTEGARRLLDELWNQIGGRAKNQSQFASQLEAAKVYARADPGRAFEIVEASVERVNELVAAASVIDGFGQEAFEQDELKMQNGYAWSSLVAQCSEALAALARTDFERAAATAERLQRLETRLPARLAVARGVLSPNAAPGVVSRRRGGVVVIRQE